MSPSAPTVPTEDLMKLIENSAENIDRIATAFAGVLREWLTPAQFEKMRVDNRRYAQQGNSSVCASQNFCDANMAMDEAFRKLFERGPHLPCDAEEGKCSEADVEHEVDIWNAAWDLAKVRDLMIPLWQHEFPDYPSEELPPIPRDWIDQSWHNDTCPFFTTPNGLGIFIDYADPDQREIPSMRFSVVVMDGASMHTDQESPLATDDWQAVLDFAASYNLPEKSQEAHAP